MELNAIVSALISGSVACVHWKGESDDIWIFSGAKSFCRGAPLSDEDTGTHTGPPQVNNQLWIIAKSGGNKVCVEWYGDGNVFFS